MADTTERSWWGAGGAEPEAELATTIIELGPDGILLAGADGRIGFANPQAEAIFGYPPHALSGMSVEDLLPDRLRDRHLAHRADYAALPHPRPMGVGLDLWARRADGSEVPVQISLSPAHVADHLCTIVFVRETTEQRAYEADAREAWLAEDQERIAADLHNRIIEHLFVVGMDMQSVMRMAQGPVAEHLDRAVAQLDLVIKEIRDTVFGRIPPLKVRGESEPS